MRPTTIFFVAFVFCPTGVLADLFGPSNYDECITKSMKGVTSDVAARAIIGSCRKQFPAISNDEGVRSLSTEEVKNLTGKAGLYSGQFAVVFPNTFAGQFYNGNENVDVTVVTIAITTNTNGDEDTREYNIAVLIPALKTSKFSTEIFLGDKREELTWHIRGAKGR